MKRRHSPALLLLLTVAAFALAPLSESIAGTAYSSASQYSSGRLFLKHSVTLGINVPLSVTIDGQPAGVFARGHVFDAALAPGSHVISVKPYGRVFDAWTGRLDVRPGEAYSYVVKYRGDQVVLAPVG